MELAGEEKKIQALFSETSLQDRATAPGFERVWARAESAQARRTRINMKPLLAIACALLIVVASAFAAWSWYRAVPTTTQHNVNVPAQPRVTPLPQSEPQLAQQSKRPNIMHRAVHQKRFTPQRATLNEAALLSRWQSPTQLLMQVPKTVDLSSLPQLNQSAEALKQFLPANTDLKKESNQ
jgi:hypothetical protein